MGLIYRRQKLSRWQREEAQNKGTISVKRDSAFILRRNFRSQSFTGGKFGRAV